MGAPAGDKGPAGHVPAERCPPGKGSSVLGVTRGGPLRQAQWVDVGAPTGLHHSLPSESVRSPVGTGPSVQGWGRRA